MEAGESDSKMGGRQRTESISGNSDSDFSDSWNVVDHMDVHNPDVPSSDGESVEVIDTETAFLGDGEEEYKQPDGETHKLYINPDTPVVRADQGESSASADQLLALHQEEMYHAYHASILRFLFFAAFAIMFSNVALLVAESVFDWNVCISKYVDQPFFLSDLPVTPKLPQQDDLSSKIAWSDEEDVTVDSVEGNSEEVAEKTLSPTEDPLDSNNKYHENFNENRQKLSLKNDNYDIGTYLIGLSEVTISKEAQNKFRQTLLILDALHIGLNDLEDVVTESSELHQVLKSQKEMVVKVTAEIQSGVLRFMDKVATNVLNKVERLEKNFEIQWCQLEKSGHKEELKGLFYNCQENEEKYDNSYDHRNQLDEKSLKKNRFLKDSYQYEVDKDSRKKEYNSHGNRKKEDIYYDFVKNERFDKSEYDHENKQEANSKGPGRLDRHENKKPISLDQVNEYENRYKQNKFEDSEKYGNVEKQPNHEMSPLNNEKYKNVNYQKSVENFGGYDIKKSGEENFEKDRKYRKPEYKRSDSKKRDDQTKISKNQKFKDSNSKPYEKPGNLEQTKSKHENCGNDENLETLEYKRSEAKYSENYKKTNKYKVSFQFKTSNNLNSLNEQFSKDLNEKENKFSKKYYQEKYLGKEHNTNKPTLDESTYQKSDFDKNQEPKKNFIRKTTEKVSKYLKEKCDKNSLKTTDLYIKLKERVKAKMKVPLELFNSMFSKYCSINKNDERKHKYKKEQSKGDRNFLDRRMNVNEEIITVNDNANIKNIVDPKLVDLTKEIGSPFGNKDEKVVGFSDKLSQWMFDYESPPNNESNVEGDWFIKFGESRSKARWYQRRSDWLFDRASHRRGGVHSPPHSNWFSGRRKNWFFRRAWAREHCRESPDSYWCHPSQDETVTIPGYSLS